MAFLTLSLFITTALRDPVAVILGQAIVFQGDIRDNSQNEGELQEVWKTWEVIVYKVTGFVCAMTFLLMGGYISYYRS